MNTSISVSEMSVTRTPRRRWVTPVVGFAAVGVVALGSQAWILGRWAAEGGLRPVPAAGDISPGRLAVIVALQVIIAVAAVVLAVLMVRRSLQARRVTLDTAMYFGFFFTFWLDPILFWDYTFATMNRHALNVATWGPYFPGWHGPHPEFQFETLLAANGVAYCMAMVFVWLQAAITTRIAQWRPHWRWGRLLPACLLAGMVADTAIELVWINTGAYSYSTTLDWATLFAGHWYQFPATAAIGATLITTPIVIMRHNQATRGTTPLIFLGSEQTRPWRGNILRVLAGIGCANLLIIAFYVASVVVSSYGGPLPADTPSYLWPPSAR